MTARPPTSATSVTRHTAAVASHRRASHPAVTSLAASIASAIPTTDSGAPGNSTTMPRIENHIRQATGDRREDRVSGLEFHAPARLDLTPHPRCKEKGGATMWLLLSSLRASPENPKA